MDRPVSGARSRRKKGNRTKGRTSRSNPIPAHMVRYGLLLLLAAMILVKSAMIIIHEHNFFAVSFVDGSKCGGDWTLDTVSTVQCCSEHSKSVYVNCKERVKRSGNAYAAYSNRFNFVMWKVALLNGHRRRRINTNCCIDL